MDEVRESKDKIEIEFEEKFRNFKDKLMKDNEEILNKERKFMQDGFKQQEKILRENAEDECEKLRERQENEITRMEGVHKKEMEYLNQKLRFLQDENLAAMKRAKTCNNDDIEDIKARQRSEIVTIEEKMEKEKSEYLSRKTEEISDNFQKKLEKAKQDMIGQRDQQIAEIINKLSEENMMKSQLYREKRDDRLDSIKDEYET